MVTAITIVGMLFIALATWFLGLWNNVLTFVNLVLASIIATNWFEPLAEQLDGGTSTYTYLLDFICIWLLFFGAFTVLRSATDTLSRTRVEFNPWLDMGLRTVFSMASAWVFACFLQFSMHLAPLPPDQFQANPSSINFVGRPDRLWMGFMQSRSRGAMAASLNEPLAGQYDLNDLHAQDKNLGCRVFDSKSDFVYKYHSRREQLSEQTKLRVLR
jgi:hypothetical protein